MKKKRLLIIGTAQQQYIRDYIAKVDQKTTEIHLLVPERDRDAYSLTAVTYFKGTFHPLFLPLLKSILRFRPDEATIVCGMTYDHDNVVKAVSFYSCFKDLKVKTSIRNIDSKADANLRPNPIQEIFKWVGLGAIASFIKLISPVIKIRVGEIYSERLGHLAMDSEIYLSEVDAGYHNNFFDLFCFKDNRIANKTLADLIKRQLRIYPFNSIILKAIRNFHLEDKHEVTMNTRVVASGRDAECLLQLTNKHFTFSKQEDTKGTAALSSLGLDPQAPYVCIFGRDSAYLQAQMPAYNDADMQEVRDMQIETFRKSAVYLLSKGLNVLRVGSVVRTPLNIQHSGFVDYSCSKERNEFMDVYLAANCKFFIGVQSGLMHVPTVFRVPCLSVNVVRLEILNFCSPEDLTIFKLLWSKSQKRILTVQEQIESGISRWRVEQFADSDIEVIDNTEDEILEATKEMHSRRNGTWTMSEEDLDLQNRFRSYFRPSYLNTKFVTPVSTYFLRKHEKELF